MRHLATLPGCLVGLLLVVCSANAGCRDDAFADACGLDLHVTAPGLVFAPRDSIAFTMELSNRGEHPVFVPGSFFEDGLLPCAVLASGKVESFKATFAAPECETLPGHGDIVLEAGSSVTFEKLTLAPLEPGVQQWSFAGVLYRCPAIPYSVHCVIESNTVELIVRPER